MSRVGYFSPEAYALAWFDRNALAEGWWADELIAEPAASGGFIAAWARAVSGIIGAH